MKITKIIFLAVILSLSGPAFGGSGDKGDVSENLLPAVRARVERLDRNQVMLFNEFLNIQQQGYIPYSYMYDDPLLVYTWDREAFILRRDMVDRYLVIDTAKLLLDPCVRAKLKTIRQDRTESQKMRLAAARMLRIADELALDAKGPERRQAIMSPALGPQSLKQPAQCQGGTVLAVASNGERPLCMLEGVDKILTEGDTIDDGFGEGITVIKISPGQVRFKKGGRSWLQKLGETPAEQWK